MADVKQELIIEIDVQGSIEKSAMLRQELDQLIKLRQELSEKSKAGDLEATKNLERVNSTIRNSQTEYKAQQRVIDGYVASKKQEVNTSNLAANSIQTNRDLLKQLTAQYIQLKNPSENATSQLRHLTDVLKKQEAAIGNTSRNVGNYGEAFQSVLGPLTSIVPGLKNAQTAQLGFNAAMTASPIGLITAGLQVLAGVFQYFGPLVDKVEQSVAALSAGFGALINGGDMLEAASQAAELTAQLQDLEDAQNGVNIANAEADARISRLLLQLRNRNVTEKEGNDILKKLAEEDEKRLKRNLAFEQELLQAKERKFIATANLSKSELDALVERSKVESEINERGLQEIIKVTGLTREQAIAQFRANEAAQAQLAESAEKRVRLKKAELDAEVALIAEQRLKVIAVQTESDLLGEKIANRAAQFQEKISAQRQKAADQLERDRKRELDNERQVAIEQEKLRQEQITALEKEISEAKKLNDQARADELEAEKNFLAQQNQQAKEYLDQRTAAEAKAAKDQELFEQQKIQSQQAGLQAASGISESIIGLIGQVAEAQGAGAEFAKALAFVQILTQQAIAIATAVTGATASGAATGPAAIGSIPAFIATLVGAVVAITGGAIGLLSQPVPKFATGVIGLDGPGSETSDSIPARLSKGESVLTAKATSKYHRELAWMEQSVGNSPNYQFGKGHFAGGFIPTVATVSGDGGYVARDIQKQNQMVDANAMIETIMRNMPEFKLSITELNEKQNSRNRSVKVSEGG